MGRRILKALLLVVAVGGFASGFASLSGHCAQHRRSVERHWADVCARSALDAAGHGGGARDARAGRR